MWFNGWEYILKNDNIKMISVKMISSYPTKPKFLKLKYLQLQIFPNYDS